MNKFKELMNKPVTPMTFIVGCILWVIVQVSINVAISTKMNGLW